MYIKFCFIDYSKESTNVTLKYFVTNVNSDIFITTIKNLCKKCKQYSFEALYNLFANYFEEVSSDSFDKLAFINCYKNRIEIEVRSGKTYQTLDEYFEWYPVKTYEGNCVDSFIHKIVFQKLNQMQKFTEDIESRMIERNTTNNYKSTNIYEKDYKQLIKIRNFARALENYCNKKLESLSDNY